MSRANGSNPEDGPNQALMRRMGSPKGVSDPIPPSQYLYFLDDPAPVQRVVAYIRSKTIRFGHRKHYAVDQDGNPITMQKMADDRFKGDWMNAKRAWDDAEHQKLVAKDGEGRLLLCGNVPSREAQLKALESQQDTDKPPVCTNWSKLCTNWSPPAYIREEIERRPEAAREAFAERYQRYLKFSDDLEADAIAAARAIGEQIEQELFAEFGIKRRVIKKQEKTRKPYVQLELLLQPDFVQGDGVQSAEPILYKSQNGAVQDENRRASLYTEGEIKPTTTEAGSQSEAEVVVVELRKHGKTTLEAAEKLVRECRERFPDATVPEVVGTIAQIARTFRSTITNPIGLLLSKVPKYFEGYARPAATPPPAPEPAPVCPRCSNTGLVGSITWNTIEDLNAIKDAVPCDCAEGEATRQLLAPKRQGAGSA